MRGVGLVGREAVVEGRNARYVVGGRGLEVLERGLDAGCVLGGVAPGAAVDVSLGGSGLVVGWDCMARRDAFGSVVMCEEEHTQ